MPAGSNKTALGNCAKLGAGFCYFPVIQLVQAIDAAIRGRRGTHRNGYLLGSALSNKGDVDPGGDHVAVDKAPVSYVHWLAIENGRYLRPQAFIDLVIHWLVAWFID